MQYGFNKIHLSCNFNTINEMSTVLKTFVAYLKRPALYPELGRKIIKNTVSRRSPFKGKAKQILGCLHSSFPKEAVSQLFL